jgi:hypothetical protein
MPSLSLNVGLNNGRKLPFGGGAAPSGLPVASTNSINVQYTAYNRTFNKINDVYGYSVSYGPEGENEDRVGFGMQVAGRWEHEVQYGLVSFNPSSDSTTIPTSGWVPSITITAA